MAGEFRYEIGQNAYVKFSLQSLKHKTSAVDGILPGRIINDDFVEISDAVPLSLTHRSIEEYFGEQGLSVVGYYQVNERFDDLELGIVAKKIGDHIFRYFPQPALLLLDNKKIEALSKGKDRSPVVQLYTWDLSKNWKRDGSQGSGRLTFKEPSANIMLLDYISSEKSLDIVDFDDHLDDISKDWLNPELFK